MTLAELSLRRPVTAVMFFVSMMVIGVIAAFRLPLEQFPEINVPFLMVNLPYASSTPQEVERSITRPAEEALATLPGIQSLNSQSRPEGSTVFIQFKDWDRDINISSSEARDRLDAIRSELPDDLQRYYVQNFSLTDQPMIRVRFSSDRDLRKDYELIQREVQRRIERVPGVARVEISGASPNEVEISVSSERLGAANLSLNQLAAKLQAINFSVSAGEIDEGQRRLRVQPVGEIKDLSELRNLVLNEQGLRLSDIAEVRLQPQRQDVGRRLDGRPAVGLDIYREQSANLVNAARNVLAELEEVKKSPELSGIQVLVFDNQAENVTDSIKELVEAGVLGSVLSLFVLYYFLRHWPSTLMVTLAIPICIVMTLGAMHFLGISLNILSMMGLLLAIGMLVDNAVVVVESIYQYREKYPNDPVRCAIEGTRAVQLAISAGTVTSIIVFLPNLFGATNQISIFLGEVAITITIALLCSWLVAVSLIPMISARLKTPPAVTAEHGFIPALSRWYAGALRWSLEHRGRALLLIASIVLVSLVPAKFVKFDMFGEDAGLEMGLYVNWKGSYSLEQMSDELKKVETYLEANRKRYHLKQIYVFYAEQGWGGLRLTLDDDVKDPKAIQELMRKEMPKLARAEIGFQGGGDSSQGAGSNEITFYVNGDSSESLTTLGEGMLPLLSKLPELRDVRVDSGDENSEIQVTVNRERAAKYGFSAQEVAQYIGIALRGAPLREFRRGNTEVPVTVRFAGAKQFRVEDMSNLNLQRADGTSVPLLSVVDVNLRKGASQISRQDRLTSQAITASIAPAKTKDDARKAVETLLNGMKLPPGYGWSWGQTFEKDDEAGSQMGLNMLLAIFMILVVMAALFESLLFPIAILSSIIFSFLGVFWVFALTGTSFSIMAMIGLLVLMGVVVNNGIVMVEHINKLRRDGMTRTDALVTGSRERLRPILMTMATAILGMLPLCFAGAALGGDGPPYYPMARAVAGGLAFSTVVSLLFLPTIYAMLDDLGIATARLVGRARENAPFAREPRVERQTA
jgi:hydrophobic/amphiphilic exporter-1 (mainly G- bacteria), HAE1 family